MTDRLLNAPPVASPEEPAMRSPQSLSLFESRIWWKTAATSNKGRAPVLSLTLPLIVAVFVGANLRKGGAGPEKTRVQMPERAPECEHVAT